MVQLGVGIIVLLEMSLVYSIVYNVAGIVYRPWSEMINVTNTGETLYLEFPML